MKHCLVHMKERKKKKKSKEPNQKTQQLLLLSPVCGASNDPKQLNSSKNSLEAPKLQTLFRSSSCNVEQSLKLSASHKSHQEAAEPPGSASSSQGRERPQGLGGNFPDKPPNSRLRRSKRASKCSLINNPTPNEKVRHTGVLYFS